ncbi:DUF3089 domain-containing protein [Leptospira langatensis]|uniref:DUF3089 domain-containing protein n=1 Tax=Leptospira langatensis TaxID=2484983 RepID=A0A5F1ZPI2_9LEPT|nr:DUF3089 domain-containing protein [Leptospira langatensis]TGK05435.1 DUF3089 domain-containing protein [Leptospira langatensis]TGL38571.1 DUF3089 domain-containing protein [Leptospira langatensis]
MKISLRSLRSRFKLLFFFAFLCVQFGCLFLLRPRKDFQESKSLMPPDYTNLDFWAAHPDKKDPADEVPPSSSYKDRQKEAQADTFFIHPTTLLARPKYWNGDLNDASLNERTNQGTIRTQASAFNDCCRVYAPRYRQAALIVFMENTPEGQQALDLAYEDVKAAFLYYMRTWNRGRPFIIASHSQGTRHSVRLIKEVIASSEYKKNLIAAYSIGFPYKPEEIGLPVCKSEKETGCAINWNSYEWGNSPKRLSERYDPSTVCVNPLTWKKDEEYAPKSMNLGSITHKFDKVILGAADAKCDKGALWVHKPEMRGFPSLGKDDSLHLVDFHMFYGNIRKNARDRADQFVQ